MSDGTDRPIGFVSRTLSVTEKRYSQLDKEALAIIFGVWKYHQYLYGREFELKTDHKPLIYIFSEKKGIPTLASGRIQRWALTLGAYRYTIMHQIGKDNVTADAMSRLPIRNIPPETRIPSEVIHLMEHLDASPTTSVQIRRWTNHNLVLSKVREWILTDWPAQEPSQEGFQPYHRRRNELSVQEGCILWGSRVIIPPKGRKSIVKMIHEGHRHGKKSFARGYVWWPGMDKELEEC